MKSLDYSFMEMICSHTNQRLQENKDRLNQKKLEEQAKKADRILTAISILLILGALTLETPH